MYIADAKMTGEIDSLCMKKYGYPELILMENASTNATNRIAKLIDIQDKVAILCGVGNNGGDGFAIARKLYNKGYNVEVFIVGEVSKIKDSAKTNLDILKKYNIDVFENINSTLLENKLKSYDVIIDCMFGAGLNRNIEGIYYDYIKKINKLKDNYKIIAIDIPSGLNGTTGEIMKACILADYTISFEFFKKGFLRYSAEKYTGKVYIEKIDIPYSVYNELCIADQFMDDNFIVDNLITKPDYSHKGNFGKVVIFAGSEDFTGAGYIVTESCIRSGAGLTTLISSPTVTNIMANKFIEAMYHSIDYDKVEDEKLDKRTLKLLDNSTAICFGPGISHTKATEKLFNMVIKNSNTPIVLDADGISILSNCKKIKDIENTIVMTPHLYEFSKIAKISVKNIEKNRLDIAKKFALENDIILVLKGKNTIITDGFRSLVSPTGNSAMANGGMGDCLSGFITSLIAQGYEPFIAASMAVYLHGKCGDEIYKTSQIVNARDIIEKFPVLLKEYYNKLY